MALAVPQLWCLVWTKQDVMKQGPPQDKGPAHPSCGTQFTSQGWLGRMRNTLTLSLGLTLLWTGSRRWMKPLGSAPAHHVLLVRPSRREHSGAACQGTGNARHSGCFHCGCPGIATWGNSGPAENYDRRSATLSLENKSWILKPGSTDPAARVAWLGPLPSVSAGNDNVLTVVSNLCSAWKAGSATLHLSGNTVCYRHHLSLKHVIHCFQSFPSVLLVSERRPAGRCPLFHIFRSQTLFNRQILKLVFFLYIASYGPSMVGMR